MRKSNPVARVGTHTPWRRGTLALGVLTACLLGTLRLQAAAPTVEQILQFRPRQPGVAISTPTPAEQARCKVELVKDSNRGSGWLLKDPQGRPLRRFFDRNADKQIDIWSYYRNGEEVYREIASKYTAKPDQFRWLNAGGSKWGVGTDKEVSHWKVISPEEVSQEILQALVSKNYQRFQALLITEGEIKALGLAGTEAERIHERLKGAKAAFQKTVAKLSKLDSKTRWLHLETGVPQCVPAEQTGSRYDLIRHPQGTILYETASGSDWLQTGEMIRVGAAWRLTGAPIPGAAPPEAAQVPGTLVNQGNNPKLQKLLDLLGEHDQKQGMLPIDGRANPKVAKHHLQRADLLEQIIAVVPANQRDPWIRQVADSLSTAIQASDPGESVASRRLQSLHEQLEKAMPRSDLTAYVVYRQLQANYSTQISTSKDINQVQEDWLKKLASFAESYPKAEDTADALLQLGMVCEFLNKEDDARKWYRQLARDFPSSVQAAKARGAEKRLQLEGQPLTLRGPLLESPGQTFDIASLQGNVVAVYYWASWNSQCASDFAKLSQIQKDLQGKLKVVAINLDNEASEARQFLDGHAAPGTVLFQEGGLESELANSYGIMVLPTLFLVDKDGRVSNRNLPISSVEDEVRKLLK